MDFFGVGSCTKGVVVSGGQVLDLSSHAKARRKKGFYVLGYGLFVLSQIRTLKSRALHRIPLAAILLAFVLS
jgi:hypothetical protein